MYLSNPKLVSAELYTPGLGREFVAETYSIQLSEVAKLGSAENPFGPSPKAMAAVAASASRIDIYPDWSAGALRAKIADKYGFAPDNVVCGAGETELISLIIRAFAGPDDEVLTYEPCFPIYFMSAEAESRVIKSVPMGPQFEFRIDEFISNITSRVKIIFVTNPHSPSGKLMGAADIRRICEAAHGKLVVVDEAYIHFSRINGSMELTREFSNVIVLRTFSKAYGLAGLRVGFGVASSVITRALMTLKPTWNLGQMQIAGATAALDDDEHVERTVSEICKVRAYVQEKMSQLNSFRMVEGSQSNFFMVEIVNPKLSSTFVAKSLLEKGVIVKDCSVSFRGLGSRYLRVDVSLQRHMDRFLQALRAIEVA